MSRLLLNRSVELTRNAVILACVTLATTCISTHALPWKDTENDPAPGPLLGVWVKNVGPTNDDCAAVWFQIKEMSGSRPPPEELEVPVNGGYCHKNYHLSVRRHLLTPPSADGVSSNHGEIVALGVETGVNCEANVWAWFERPTDLGTVFMHNVHECAYFIKWLDKGTVRVWQIDHMMTETAPEHTSQNQACSSACDVHELVLHRFKPIVKFHDPGKYWVACRCGEYLREFRQSDARVWLEPHLTTDEVPRHAEWLESDRNYRPIWPCDPFSNTWEHAHAYCAVRQGFETVTVDLDIDSDNEDGYGPPDCSPAEDVIEDNSALPGKLMAVNDDDSDGDGIPDFADGFDRDGIAGNDDNLSTQDDFVQMVLTLPETVDMTKARIRFTYSASPPSGVSVSGTTPPVYTPAPGNLRIWLKDGDVPREKASCADALPGDYVPPIEYPDLSKLGLAGSTRSITLYVEATDESAAMADQRVLVELDPDGASGPFGWGAVDAVRVTIIKVDLVTTDITGLHGIGSTAAASVPRVPLSQEPDGIACDGSDGVDDGARLLVRALIPDFLDAATVSSLSADWGYIDGSGNFATLPASPKQEGEYIALTSADETALTGLGIHIPGQAYEIGSGRQVLAAQIYKPPVEFDLGTPNNTDKERNLKLAADVKLSGSDFCKPEKDVALVRPPLVLVHGVNSNPEMWGETSSTDADQFTVQFDTGSANWGFQCIDFRVAHNVPDPYLASEGNTLGFGEISHMYERVRDMVGGQSSSATDRFRAGSYFSSKRIAVQKVDIVAHSYGGLLSRWYTKWAGTPAGSEFADRKDVRKVITLCSPHRGSPLANMVCEVFKNPLIAGASSEGIGAFELSMANLLSAIDIAGFGTPLPGGVAQGKLPNALTSARTAPRHAYEIFSVNSQRLAQMNASPFHDDIGYAAVVGTDEWLVPVLLRPFKALQPNWDPITGASKPYFPWIWEFNDGATDAIVPTWSAPLGVASHNANINVNHVSVGKHAAVNAQVRTWLNNALPRGAAQRAAFDGNPPVSERNAYVGSTVGAGGISSGGGLTPDAIVKVELSAATPFDVTYTTDPSDVGIKPAILTGMIRVNRIGTPAFTIVADEISDEDLHALGALAAGSLGIPAGQMSGAGATDFVAYRITSGTIGRKHKNILTGPTDVSGEDDDHLVGYEMDDIPGGQSPPTEAATPDFVLPAPTKGGAGNLLITVNGAVQTTDAGNPTQISEVQLWDQDTGVFAPDDKLIEWNITVNHPAGVWNGLLIPYSGSATLYLEGGNVRGADGTSDENPAQVYQKLIEPGITPNADSATITVP